MDKRLLGKDVEIKIKEAISVKLHRLKSRNIIPRLAIVSMGDNPGDLSYKRSLKRFAESMGIDIKDLALKGDIETDELLKNIELLNEDDSISGILVLRPFPNQVNDEIISKAIHVDKDVDCMHPMNLAKVFAGSSEATFYPCTAEAVIRVMKHNDIEIEGKNVVIVNRSLVVGKSLAMMLLEENATITICHSRTKDLEKITSQGDVVVTAMGRANMLDSKYFKEGAIVLDAGISLGSDGKITGDVDFDDVYEKVGKITPVPGGIGRITTSILYEQMLDSELNKIR